MKYAKWECDSLYDRPGYEAVEVELHWVGLDLLRFKRVNNPHGHVADKQECYDLASWFGAVVFWKMNATAGNVADKKQLKDDLNENISFN